MYKKNILLGQKKKFNILLVSATHMFQTQFLILIFIIDQNTIILSWWKIIKFKLSKNCLKTFKLKYLTQIFDFDLKNKLKYIYINFNFD